MNEATLMERLRDGTADLHTSAEGKDFQRSMIRGEITAGEYGAWLAQMLHVHRSLEGHLRNLLREDPHFAAVREEQMQEPYLLADLAALGADAKPPLPATAGLVAEIERAAKESPLSLLGFHYVLEGSNNGNRFIARQIKPALGLEDGGCRYLEPYGEAQPAKWAQFKQDMNALTFTPEQIDLLVASARRMFEAIGEISDELQSTRANA